MDGEGKKVVPKKRSKLMESNLDPDDDEPIGSLFKLKGKKKKIKLGTDGENDRKGEVKVEKDGVSVVDFGGMEDTLASFKKKLKGPKKDSFGIVEKNESLLNPVGLSDGCSIGLPKGESFVTEFGLDDEDAIHLLTSDVNINKKSGKKRESKLKTSKSVADANNLEVLVNMGGAGLSDGNSSENAMEKLWGQCCQQTKVKKDRRTKSAAAAVANGFSSSIKSNDGVFRGEHTLGDQVAGKKGRSSSSDENLAVSLSSFFRKAQKAQSGLHKKLRCSSSKSREIQVLEKDCFPSSDGVSSDVQASPEGFFFSDARPCSKGQKSEDSLSGSIQLIPTIPCNTSGRGQDQDAVYGTSEPVVANLINQESSCNLIACSNDKGVLKHNVICEEAGVIQEGSLNKSCDKGASEPPSTEIKKHCASGSHNDEPQTGVRDVVPLNASNMVNDIARSISGLEFVGELSKPDKSESNLISDGNSTELVEDKKGGDDALLVPDVSERGNGISFISVKSNGNGACEEDAKCFPEANNACNRLVVNERAVRKAKKRKDGDMAYEGDIAWDVLEHVQRSVYKDQGTKLKERLYSSANADPDIETGGVAAVSVGLKAHAVGPVEKIKFKEVLKRKGGPQEYLECRNKILSLWNKDVTRILPLTDCVVSATSNDNEPPRSSLMRDIYMFLNQSGYINVGIASHKEKAEPNSRGNYKLLGGKKFEGGSGASVADSADGVSFILGQIRFAETSTKAMDDIAVDDENHSIETVKSGAETVKSGAETVFGTFPDKLLDGCHNVEELDKLHTDVKPSERIAEANCSTAEVRGDSPDNGIISNQSMPGQLKGNDLMQCELQNRKKIIVVGAGPAGLTAARHLQRQGFSVTVLEARSRLGGRVYTDRSSLSVPVDLGASIITGVEADVAGERRPDPSSLVCAQLGLELTVLNSDCPLYDVVTGQKVPADIDEALEAEFNGLLDDMVFVVTQKGENAARMSLEDGLEYGLKKRHKVLPGSNYGESKLLKPLVATFNHDNDTDVTKGEMLSPLERRVMDWHFAHLEYGCAALLKDVSLPHWNQDDVYGGFGGAHCMIKGGYGAVVESIAHGLSIHLNQVVANISYRGYGMESERADNFSHMVKVSTTNGNEFFGDAVLITVPLGCLKTDSIKFAPPLPEWKHSAIQRLGFGVLNKVVLEFSEVFWDDTVDYFGATADHTDMRGRCFMFWNVKKTVGAPVLIALVVGKAAIDGQDSSPSDQVSHALSVLRKLFGDNAVPDPVASVVTDWGRDPFSYGAYSYVAVGASGEDYDILGRPVENCLFFAGEATCKEHPDTVGGAMMSGLREAVRIIDILTTGNDYTAEAEAIEAAQRQSNNERNEVKDISRRLDEVGLSDVFYRSPSDKSPKPTRERLFKDMFFSARTSAGRLRLAKELLSLPVESLKSFAGNKEGLTVLNSWIMDSMGKDGTQLLRHCVRILVLVSTDLVAVRLSGIGKTVKEKVCVHTSRDIRGIASQLVNMWIEVFRKEKVSNGGLKSLRYAGNTESLKAKGKDPSSRKPSARVQHCATENKSNLSSKQSTAKQVKLETAVGSKAGSKAEEDENVPLSEEERDAVAAAEAAHAAALAAAKAYASSENRYNSMQLPKIPSFQKFARREQYAHIDDSERKRWSGGVLGRQDCTSEIDSRNCRVRDWSVDFTAAAAAACANVDSSRMSADNLSQRSHSNDMPQVNWREHSGESAAGDSTALTKAWVDSSGSVGAKDYHAIERWQCQAAAAEYEFQSSMHAGDEEDSNTMSKSLTQKHEGVVNESLISQVTVNNELSVNQRKGTEHIKQGVVDYVASLLMPLYKARKIDKDGYKSIMKKSATKVMEQTTDAEKAMAVFEFLDFKRKNKIRAFVDNLIERHMSMKPVMKS